MADQFYIEEFLFRGRPEGDARPSGWHLIIGLNGSDPMGRPYAPLPIKTSEQAVAEGWDLPTVLAEINRDVLAELEAERAAKAEAERQLTEALSGKAQVEAMLAAAVDENAALKAEQPQP